MIQAAQPKLIETPKAQPKAEVVSNSKALKGAEAKVKTSASETSDEASEFAKELEANLNPAQTEVKAVQVSAEQALELPSTLVQPTGAGTVESTSPKVFDPALTKGVEKLIQPTTTEAAPVQLTDAQVLELANANPETEMPVELKTQIEQAMLKTPQVTEGKEAGKQALVAQEQSQVANGRAPAIDLAKSEIDPQLLNNEDFVAQKNLATKKSLPNAYGMKAVPAQQQKIALEAGLKETQVVKEAGAIESAPVNSQQFILGLMGEQKVSQANETQAPARVFDMNHVKTSDSDKIINQITDYVVQAKAAKEPTVNMRVNHDELGMIDITVSKAGVNHESVAINIGTHSIDGKNFFQQNSKDLFSHLTNHGINVSDLKVETPTQTAKNDFDFGSQSGKNQNGSEKQFGSEQNQRRHESERRQDLWKLLNKEAA